MEASARDVEPVRCSFCGKSREGVRTIMVSGSNAICDECVVTALERMSQAPGQITLRLAFSAFRIVASFGSLFRGRSG